jgi:hypothetical protein
LRLMLLAMRRRRVTHRGRASGRLCGKTVLTHLTKEDRKDIDAICEQWWHSHPL